MPLLRKEILPAGTYSVMTANGRVTKEFSPSYLRHVSKNANKMIKAGLRIPTPFGHSKDAVPHATDNPKDNAGYWHRFWVSNENGKPGIWGEVDVPGNEDDPNSPYYKAKHTAKETSVCIHEQYVDGKQRKWDNAIMHVALVNHPVVPGQKDFEHVPDNTSVVNMSMLSTHAGLDSENISGLVKKLRDVVKLYLPDNCTIETIVKDLIVAVGQYELCSPKQDGGIVPAPVYLSTQADVKDQNMPMSNEQIQSIVATGAINPVTGKPFAAEDFAVQSQATPEDKKSAALLKAFTNKLVEQAKNSVIARINSLVESGRISKEYADTHLQPKVEFQMSLIGTQENPAIADHPLVMTLSALESLPTPTKQPQGGTVPVGHVNPFQSDANDFDGDQAEAIKMMLSTLPTG